MPSLLHSLLRIASVACCCWLFTVSSPVDAFSAALPKRSNRASALSIAAPSTRLFIQQSRTLVVLYQSSFAADGSEYSSMGDKSSELSSDEYDERFQGGSRGPNKFDDQDETPTIELQPVPLSKNAGNRFVAFVWDRTLTSDTQKDALDLHYDRIAKTEDHVLFCRKANLYHNDTAADDEEHLVDILWSLPMYVSDARVLSLSLVLVIRHNYPREILCSCLCLKLLHVI